MQTTNYQLFSSNEDNEKFQHEKAPQPFSLNDARMQEHCVQYSKIISFSQNMRTKQKITLIRKIWEWYLMPILAGGVFFLRDEIIQ
jgi:hypothetical protein